MTTVPNFLDSHFSIIAVQVPNPPPMEAPNMTTTVPDTYGGLYAAAAAKIRRDGWTQDSYGTVDGPTCLIGAVNTVSSNGTSTVVGPIGVERQAGFDLGSLLYGGGTTNGVYCWNDRIGRTQDEVVKLLELAAWVYDDQPLEVQS